MTIFKAADLAGELSSIEEDLELLESQNEGEEQTLSAGAEKTELIEKRDRLQAELEESAVDFTVQALEQDEVERITKEARKAASELADQAAKDAASYARDECRRAEVGDGKEIKEAVRRAASNASNAVLAREAGLHVLSHAIVTDTGARAFTPEQMRIMSEKLGQPQMNKLYGAFYDLTSTDPGSFVPKSQKPGPRAEG
ncbi:hypothetical protein QYM46_12955 [Brevibacterium sp. K11IcPPYGO002]|uniref:hypothetical protein n=1 Tax=Brevibacterium sp. K11IcPPYGO002 TaxID=3058837 RepID=UPI003D81BDC2